MALRRWKPFLATFDHIDAGGGQGSLFRREEFKRARNQIVETLCGATDDGVAEALCRLLDDAMAESLVTLRTAVHADKEGLDLLASGELVAAVGALARGHESARVRGLARGVVCGWRAAVEEDFATASAAMVVLDRLVSPPPTTPRPHEDTASATGVSGCYRDNKASPDLDTAAAAGTKKQQSAVPVKKQQPRPRPPQRAAAGVAKIAEPSPKKKDAPLVVVRGGGGCSKSTSPDTQASSAKAPAPQQQGKKTVKSSPPLSARSSSGDDRLAALCIAGDKKKKMEATKRKLHERYQEAEDAKRRRTVQVLVVAPEMPRKHKTLHAVKTRGPAFSAAENRSRFSKPALQRI